MELATTIESTTSIISLEDETVGKDSNFFDVVISDDEDILVNGTNIIVTLKQQNGDVFMSYPISHSAITTVDFINLLSNHDYVVEFTATFDTVSGPKTEVIYTHNFTTLEMVLVEVTIDPTSIWVSAPNLTLDITLGTDDDNVAVDDSWNAVLYQDGIAVATVDLYVLNGSANPENNTLTVTFAGFDHLDGSMYTVVVEADIDMNLIDPSDPGSGFVTTDVKARTFVNAEN